MGGQGRDGAVQVGVESEGGENLVGVEGEGSEGEGAGEGVGEVDEGAWGDDGVPHACAGEMDVLQVEDEVIV